MAYTHNQLQGELFGDNKHEIGYAVNSEIHESLPVFNIPGWVEGIPESLFDQMYLLVIDCVDGALKDGTEILRRN